MRFDVPVVWRRDDPGDADQPVRLRLSLDAGRTLMFERDAMIASADEAGITIVGREKRGFNRDVE